MRGDTIMTLAEILREEGKNEGRILGLKEGLKEGLEQGLEQGSKKSKLDVARNLVQMDLEVNQIISATGLSEKEVMKLIQEIKN